MIAEDGEGAVTFVNAAAERLLGWKAAELIGKRGHPLVHFRRRTDHRSRRKTARSATPWGAVSRCTSITTTSSDVTGRRSRSPTALRRFGPTSFAARWLFSMTSASAPLKSSGSNAELEKLSWVGRIRDALDQHKFVLYAQPVLDLKTKLVVQHELLLRMISPSGEIVLPAGSCRRRRSSVSSPRSTDGSWAKRPAWPPMATRWNSTSRRSLSSTRTCSPF